MNSLIPLVGTIGLLGSALVGGVFFAFSSFVMKALALCRARNQFFPKYYPTISIYMGCGGTGLKFEVSARR